MWTNAESTVRADPPPTPVERTGATWLAPPGASCTPLCLRLPDRRTIPIERQLKIGQSSSNHVAIRDPLVSRSHCCIEVARGMAIIQDLHSTNGTFVNGVRVANAQLEAGAVINIGRTTLRVCEAEERTKPTEPAQQFDRPATHPQAPLEKYVIDGAKMRFIREDHEMTVRALAEKSGVDPKTIVDLEKNRRRWSYLGTVKDLAVALDCDWRELVG
jgi:DNA-binding XRE family transcriptional regulator